MCIQNIKYTKGFTKKVEKGGDKKDSTLFLLKGFVKGKAKNRKEVKLKWVRR